MNPFIRFIALVLLISGLAYQTTVHARLLLITGGEIQSLSNSKLVLGDLGFNISPTVKVLSADNKPLSLKNLKIGDTVRIEVHEVAGKRFIDRISLIPSSKKR